MVGIALCAYHNGDVLCVLGVVHVDLLVSIKLVGTHLRTKDVA